MIELSYDSDTCSMHSFSHSQQSDLSDHLYFDCRGDIDGETFDKSLSGQKLSNSKEDQDKQEKENQLILSASEIQNESKQIESCEAQVKSYKAEEYLICEEENEPIKKQSFLQQPKREEEEEILPQSKPVPQKPCINGATCWYLARNRCNYYHPSCHNESHCLDKPKRSHSQNPRLSPSLFQISRISKVNSGRFDQDSNDELNMFEGDDANQSFVRKNIMLEKVEAYRQQNRPLENSQNSIVKRQDKIRLEKPVYSFGEHQKQRNSGIQYEEKKQKKRYVPKGQSMTKKSSQKPESNDFNQNKFKYPRKPCKHGQSCWHLKSKRCNFYHPRSHYETVSQKEKPQTKKKSHFEYFIHRQLEDISNIEQVQERNNGRDNLSVSSDSQGQSLLDKLVPNFSDSDDSSIELVSDESSQRDSLQGKFGIEMEQISLNEEFQVESERMVQRNRQASRFYYEMYQDQPRTNKKQNRKHIVVQDERRKEDNRQIMKEQSSDWQVSYNEAQYSNRRYPIIRGNLRDESLSHQSFLVPIDSHSAENNDDDQVNSFISYFPERRLVNSMVDGDDFIAQIPQPFDEIRQYRISSNIHINSYEQAQNGHSMSNERDNSVHRSSLIEQTVIHDQSDWLIEDEQQIVPIQSMVSYRSLFYPYSHYPNSNIYNRSERNDILRGNQFTGSLQSYFDKNKTIKTSQLSKQQIQKLQQCPICFQALKQPVNPEVKPDLSNRNPQTSPLQENQVTQLFCKHTYHKKCIQKWILQSSPNCPMCRKDFRDHEEYKKKKEEEKPIQTAFVRVSQRYVREEPKEESSNWEVSEQEEEVPQRRVNLRQRYRRQSSREFEEDW